MKKGTKKANPRCCYVLVHVTEQEHADIRAIAEHVGESMSEIVHDLIVKAFRTKALDVSSMFPNRD